jgi:hypothetical protein
MTQIKGMSNKETKEWLLKWCEKPERNHFSWPTDACGYDQHIKFVDHRNSCWEGHTFEEFVQFVKDYALSLNEDE